MIHMSTLIQTSLLPEEHNMHYRYLHLNQIVMMHQNAVNQSIMIKQGFLLIQF